MLTIENRGSRIYLFGRKSNRPTVDIVDDFKPYFYVPDEEGEFISIDGIKLKKINCNYPGEVKELREKHPKHYEADVVYTNRFIIDRIENFEKENIRICYVDIEIARTELGYDTPENANNPLLAICCYDSYAKEYKQFCVGSTHKDEKTMVKDFVEYLHLINPDMLVAWNGDGFDFPFLINRMLKIGIDPNKLSRCEGTVYTKKLEGNRYFTRIFGRVLFDLMKGYKKISQGGRESWALEYISNYEGLGGKEKYKGELDDLHKNDIKKFMDYNKRDVELLVLLNEKLRIVDFFDEVRKLCFCKFEDVFMNSKIGDCLCLKNSKGKFILPSVNHDIEDVTYPGAFVHDIEAKLHRNIAVMDFKCIPSGEYVYTKNGYKKIENLKVGDISLSLDNFENKVKNIVKQKSNQLVELTLNSGDKIRMTKNHLFHDS